MATVYGGTDTVLRRRVAVKVLHPQYASDAEFVRRFYQEAESAAKLSHPNIVNTYDVGREGDTYYIVMELVDGPSLSEVISDGPLPEPVAIDYAAQICNGLAYAHRSGLLHRDIKPANILVTKDDVVKLSDFGIARAVSQNTMHLTKPGLVMGSVFYMSPEQAQSKDLHEASDLYSVGVVLYQMLTGTLPFSGESPVTIALKHIGDPVPTIDTKKFGVSPALASIVNKLLQKTPASRFHSASEAATALREARERPSVAAYQISDDAPTQVFHQPPPRRSPMPDRSYTSISDEEELRSRNGGRAIALLAVLAVIATGLGYWLFGRPTIGFGGGAITVADFTNMTDAQAQAAVVNAGLVARFIKTSSDTVPANHVIRQNPSPGTHVDKNALIELIVSNGLPTIGLRDVRGFNFNDAQRTLKDDGFQVKEEKKFDKAAPDSVVDQKPAARSQVRKNAVITLIVSQGPEQTQIPDFVGMNVADAVALAKQSGVTLDVGQRAPDPGVPKDEIASQDIPPGTRVDKSVTIHALVSLGGPANAGNTVVPSVVDHNYADAISALNGAGFTAAVSYSVQVDRNGIVVNQQPSAGTQVAPGSTITITLSVNGQVPDTVGLSIEAAQAELARYGYRTGKILYTTTEGAGGKVVGTDPEAGTNLPPGSELTLIVNGPAH